MSAEGAGAVTTRRRVGDGAIPGGEGGDVIRRERPEVQGKREKGAAGMNAMRCVGGERGGRGRGGGEVQPMSTWCGDGVVRGSKKVKQRVVGCSERRHRAREGWRRWVVR